MKPFRLNRRTVLRGAGGMAVALPWLEAMQPERPAHAQAQSATRFVAAYWPGGTVLDQFLPVGTEDNFQLSPILAPFANVKDWLVVLQGLDMKCKNGEQNAAGMVAWLTGGAESPELSGSPASSSLDQVLADHLASPVMYQAVRWATKPSQTLNTYSVVSYRADGQALIPQQPLIDPVATWNQWFGNVAPGVSPDWRHSILDSVLDRYKNLSARLGARDRMLLDRHMEYLRDIEQRVALSCRAPDLIDTASYNPQAFGPDLASDAAMPAVGKLMMDMMVAALACDMTRVATFQWADSNAGYTLPWLNLDPPGQVQNFYEHNGGYRPVEMAKIFTWYSSQHAYLLEQMSQVQMNGHTLLDESVVFFGTQVSLPPEHSNTNMPFLLAGGGGGLRGNRYRTYAHRPHNDLLVAIANLFGDTRTSFGDPMFNTGSLGDLTL